MARAATIGPAIFEQVNKLVADGKTRTEAFAQIAQERKSRPGTVSANYYRVARQQGQERSRRRSSAPAATRVTRQRVRRRTRTQTSRDGDLRQTANQISHLVQQLVSQVEERDRRIRELVG